MFNFLKKKQNPNQKSNYVDFIEDENGIISVFFNNSKLNKINGEYIYDEKSATEIISNPLYNDDILAHNTIFEWTLFDNDYIEKGNTLFTLRKANNDSVREILSEVFILDPPISPKSGIIKILKDEREILKNGDLICKILPTSIENSNSPENNSYVTRFNRYEIPSRLRNLDNSTGKKHISLTKWLVENNSKIQIGDEIAEIKGGNAYSTYFTYRLKAKKSGILSIIKNDTSFLNNGLEQNETLCIISDNFEVVFNNTYFNKHKIEFDVFTNTKIIKWEIVGGYMAPFNSDFDSPIGGIISNSEIGKDLIFSFENVNKRDYLTFYFFSYDYKLDTGDKINFLFKNEKIFNFEIVEKPIKSNLNWKNLFETRVLLTSDEIEYFKNHKLDKWKINFNTNNQSIIGDADNYYWYSGDNYNKVLKRLVTEYVELVKIHIDDYKPLKKRETVLENQSKTQEECFVYLMIDTTNNFHKIGISNKPEYREKTLQADKPTIELIVSKRFPNRKIAESIEKSLHLTFKEKRIRGEWFELDNNEVDDVIETLK